MQPVRQARVTNTTTAETTPFPRQFLRSTPFQKLFQEGPKIPPLTFGERRRRYVCSILGGNGRLHTQEVSEGGPSEQIERVHERWESAVAYRDQIPGMFLMRKTEQLLNTRIIE
jgi:hypothetical protein